MNCKIENKISDVLFTVTSLGSISVESHSSLVIMQTQKDKQAQTFHHVDLTTINDIKVTLKNNFDFTGVSGCSVSCTRTIFLVDSITKRLLSLKKDETLKSEIPLSMSYLDDVTCIDDKTVAVTLYHSKQIQIINITAKSVERTIKTAVSCFGKCYRDDCLLSCDTNEVFRIKFVRHLLFHIG
ncbi:unnamed protein product [Mytilus coruscus]|uniref:Uncharacterized protein n=1 Tax=Mytilus coruscus TaxID=42192 RepID=A0A6J7ZTN8_MYTCO|nr:unnamed protein product [Mytilus coruscus]